MRSSSELTARLVPQQFLRMCSEYGQRTGHAAFKVLSFCWWKGTANVRTFLGAQFAKSNRARPKDGMTARLQVCFKTHVNRDRPLRCCLNLTAVVYVCARVMAECAYGFRLAFPGRLWPRALLRLFRSRRRIRCVFKVFAIKELLPPRAR